MKMYEVGGCVRDEIIGVPSKDIDFSIVLDESDMDNWFIDGVGDPFRVMVNELSVIRGFKIHREYPDRFTAIGKFPRSDSTYPGVDADFVLARRDGTYTDGRRPDFVEVGTLHDDLARRDFTMNAIAKDSDGTYIDPFDGQADIKNRLIRTVGDPVERFTEDALRALRALRFAVTKDFFIAGTTRQAMTNPEVLKLITKVSGERVREELNKALAVNTPMTVMLLGSAEFAPLTNAIFSGSVSLEATMKQRKGR